MPKAKVQFTGAGRQINPTNGMPGPAVQIPANSQIQYEAADVYQNGWVGGNACQCIRSYSLIKDASGNCIETTQPVIIGQ